MKVIPIFIFFTYLQILCVFTSFAQDKVTCYQYDSRVQPVDLIIDIIHLRAELRIDPYEQRVDGISTYNFKTFQKTTDSILFHIPDIKINSININGVPGEFKYLKNNVIVYPGQKLGWLKEYTLTFDYVAYPTNGLHFIGWNDPKNIKRKQIWAHNPVYWIPYINQKHDILTSELIVTFNEKYKIYSNGERLSVKENGDGTKTWHYRLDKSHVVYLMNLIIGDYDYKSSETKRGVPLELWYYPDQEDHFEPTYQHTEYMFEFFEKEMGVNYPWSLYREVPVIDYLYGAMETTTATMYGDFLHIDKRGYWGRNYINVNAHELAHQWFGNYVSHLNNRHTWLTESFATYYAKVFERDVFGEDYYQNVRNDEAIKTFEAAEKNNNPVMHSHAGTNRWYPKGSLVLDMLRNVLGNDEFKLAVKHYLKSNAHKVVDTNDFLKAIREVTGKSMDWFFEEWIYRGGEPHYRISYKEYEDLNLNRNTHIFVEQIHKTDNLVKLFKMPILFEVHYKDGTFDKKKQWIAGIKEEVIIPNKNKKEIAFVLFDPDRQIIKKVTFEKSFEELFNQALNAPNMIDRYDALLQLRSFPLSVKNDLLLKCYDQETFHLTKGEILYHFSGDSSKSTISLIKKAIYDSDAYIRRAILFSVPDIPEIIKSDYEILLKDSSYINVELALTNLTNSFPDKTDKYLDITEDGIGWRGNNIRIKWLEIAIRSGQTNYLNQLIDYSSKGFEFETRINALNSIKNLDYLDNVVIKKLTDAYFYWNFKLSGTAKEILKHYLDQSEFKDTILNYIDKNNWNSEEMSMLEKLLK